jgi:hypothetical protein
MGGRRGRGHKRYANPAQPMNPQDNGNGGEKQSPPSNPPIAEPVIPQAAVGPDEDKPVAKTQDSPCHQSQNEGRLAQYTRSLRDWTVGLVFVGLLTVGVLVLQRCTFEKTDETLRAAQRPWMKFSDMVLLEPIHCDADVIKTKVRLFLENGGNSPALHVEGNAFLNIEPGTLISDKKIHKLCDPIRLAKPNTGLASFPNSKPITVDIDVSSTRMGLGVPMPIIPTIIACVTYRFSFGDGEGHQTGMMVNYAGPKHSGNPGNDLGGLAVNCPAGTNLKPEDLDRTISPLGSYAD